MTSKNTEALAIINEKINKFKAQIETLDYDTLESLSNVDINIPVLAVLDEDNGNKVTLSVFRNGEIVESEIYKGTKKVAWKIYEDVSDALDAPSMIHRDGIYYM